MKLDVATKRKVLSNALASLDVFNRNADGYRSVKNLVRSASMATVSFFTNESDVWHFRTEFNPVRQLKINGGWLVWKTKKRK